MRHKIENLQHVSNNQHLSAVKNGREFFPHVEQQQLCLDIRNILYAHKLINFRHSGANIVFFFHAFFVLT